MGDLRRNYVMSVELAMQREMAYREKLECQQMERGGSSSSSSFISSSMKDPLLSQVTTPTSSQAPRMIPGATPTPHPRPTLGPFPNPRPHPSFGPRPGQVPPPRPNTWYGGPTPGPIPLVRPPFPRPGPISGPSHSADHHKRKQPHQVGGNFYCNLCEVDCTSPINLRMHKKGHKHKAKLKEAKGTQMKAAGGGTGAKEHIHCELCGIWCTDEFAFTLHLNGKNHILKLHAAEKKLKSPDGGSVA